MATVRLLSDTDSIAAITDLLHCAYASLGAAGLNYTAVDQSVAETASRISRGECAVAIHDAQIVGTITVVGTKPNASTPWFREAHVATAHQFAVEPSFRRRGIGSMLMSWAESWARQHGYRELSVDTAEPAEHLVTFYAQRGYRFIQCAQWPGKHYRTVILSKALTVAP